MLCMGLIFYFSSQDGISSDILSQSFTEKIAKVIFHNYEYFSDEFQKTVIFELNMFIRKVAHFSIFFFMSIFIYAELIIWIKKYLINGLISIGLCMMYAILDEYHQSFTPGRTPLIKDIFIDTAGATLGVVFCFTIMAIIHFIKHIMQKNNSVQPSAS